MRTTKWKTEKGKTIVTVGKNHCKDVALRFANEVFKAKLSDLKIITAYENGDLLFLTSQEGKKEVWAVMRKGTKI